MSSQRLPSKFEVGDLVICRCKFPPSAKGGLHYGRILSLFPSGYEVDWRPSGLPSGTAGKYLHKITQAHLTFLLLAE